MYTGGISEQDTLFMLPDSLNGLYDENVLANIMFNNCIVDDDTLSRNLCLEEYQNASRRFYVIYVHGQ
jgi:hypothetical protein